jgi:hypothetical protein
MAVTYSTGRFKFVAIITIATRSFPRFKFFFRDLSIKLGNGSVSLKRIWNVKKNKSTSKVTILTKGYYTHQRLLHSPKVTTLTKGYYTHQRLLHSPKVTILTKGYYTHQRLLYSPKSHNITASQISPVNTLRPCDANLRHLHFCETTVKNGWRKIAF